MQKIENKQTYIQNIHLHMHVSKHSIFTLYCTQNINICIHIKTQIRLCACIHTNTQQYKSAMNTYIHEEHRYTFTCAQSVMCTHQVHNTQVPSNPFQYLLSSSRTSLCYFLIQYFHFIFSSTCASQEDT